MYLRVPAVLRGEGGAGRPAGGAAGPEDLRGVPGAAQQAEVAVSLLHLAQVHTH